MGARLSAPVHTGPGAHPTSYTMSTASFLGVKRPGPGVIHSPPSTAEVKERIQLDLYFPSGPSRPVAQWTLPLPLPHVFYIMWFWCMFPAGNMETRYPIVLFVFMSAIHIGTRITFCSSPFYCSHLLTDSNKETHQVESCSIPSHLPTRKAQETSRLEQGLSWTACGFSPSLAVNSDQYSWSMIQRIPFHALSVRQKRWVSSINRN
jgi:hypothetical protein